MTIRGVFLDRDGTLNEDAVGFASRRKEATLLPGIASAIRKLNEKKIPVIVISNQAGIARGIHSEEDAHRFNESLAKQLAVNNAHVDGWYFCPHHPEGTIARYAISCECRKPKTGLLQRAAREHGVDLSQSVMVGDKATDIEAGHAVGAQTILVQTGQGAREWARWKQDIKPSFVAQDLSDAVEYLFRDMVA